LPGSTRTVKPYIDKKKNHSSAVEDEIYSFGNFGIPVNGEGQCTVFREESALYTCSTPSYQEFTK
jgi:hypothetical protein